MISRAYLVVIFVLFLLIGIACDADVAACKREALQFHLDVEDDLQEDEWLTYFGRCFLFQAPVGSRVYVESYGVFNRVKVYYLGEGPLGDGLLTISWGKGGDFGLSNAEINIGGMKARRTEVIDEELYAGEISIELPLSSIRVVSFFYEDLTRMERNLAIRIATSLRLHLEAYPYPPTTIPQGDTLEIEPISDLESARPSVVYVRNSSGRLPPCF